MQPFLQWKAISIFLALFIQDTMRMRRIILSSVACPVLQYFSTLSHKRHHFRKTFIEHKMCDLFLQFCLKHFQSEKKRARCDQQRLFFVT